MAEVFAPEGFKASAGATGDPLDDYIAHMPGVRNQLRFHANAKARRARAPLAAHRHEGRASISVTEGDDLDWYVNLDDPDGNALTIELGRAPAIYEDGHMDAGSDGLYVLTDATGAARPTGPRAPRNRRGGKRRTKRAHTHRGANGKYARKPRKG